MKVKDIAKTIDSNTPFVVRDIEDNTLFSSWLDDENKLPDMELCMYGGITYHKKEQLLVLYVEED